MSEKDNATKNFMEKDENFADAFNFLVFDGKPVIKPENLKPKTYRFGYFGFS